MLPLAGPKTGLSAHFLCDLLTIKTFMLKPIWQAQVLCELNTGINMAFFVTLILPTIQAFVIKRALI